MTSLKIPTRICPKCKSIDVSPDLSVESFAQGSVFNRYICNKCGYSGIFFPEIYKEELPRKNRKSFKSKIHSLLYNWGLQWNKSQNKK